MTALAQIAVVEAIRRAIPDGTGSVSVWAEQNRFVGRGARKGKWSNKTTPYLVEIMDAFSDPFIREVVVMKPAQWGGSEALANVVGYYIDTDPDGDIAYVAEKEDKTRSWMVESFDTMVRATPSLAALVKTADEDNNQKVKKYPGGTLRGLWASSPGELSSFPFRILLFDERAAYKPTSEGDAVSLGEERGNTFEGIGLKIGKVSTPRMAGDSADIEADFLRGDKRQYWVPCPSCESLQLLEWKNVHWDGSDPDLAYMACVHCGVQLEYEDLEYMLDPANGARWIKDADLAQPFWPDHPADPEVASFRSNQLYSPFVPWIRTVKKFLDAKKKGPGSPQMQTWVNTSLGEPWRPYEKLDYMDLTLNREDYAAEVPDGVLVLTAACDVQGNRLEYEVVGWGRDDESWSIEYGVIDGDPGQDDVWDELEDKWTRVFKGANDFRVQCAMVDSGGHHTQQVYKFAKRNAGRRWFACKGMGDRDKPIVGKPTWVDCRVPGYGGKVRLFPVGTNAAKDDVFSKLRIAEPGPGFCHFPTRPEYDDAYLKQLCSEKKILRARLGVTYYVYEKVTANARNEALDLRVYNTAARVKLSPNYENISRRRLQHIEVADAPIIEGEERFDPRKPNVVPFQGRRQIMSLNDPFAR